MLSSLFHVFLTTQVTTKNINFGVCVNENHESVTNICIIICWGQSKERSLIEKYFIWVYQGFPNIGVILGMLADNAGDF